MSVAVRPVEGAGEPIHVIELSNPAMTVRLLDVGASLWQLVPAGHPAPDGVCLFHPDPTAYAHNPGYLGSTVGPVANRIADSTFELDGRVHRLTPNEGPHHLHGGPTGFGRRVWTFGTDAGADAVQFQYNRPAGEGGYPGDLDVAVTWTLTGDCLRFEWSAATDDATPVSITNHAYWNLAGGGTVHDHVLRVDASTLVAVDDVLVPTGELADVAGTPFDLRTGVRVGDALVGLDGPGLDHCYVLDANDRDAGALLVDPGTGLGLEVRTSLPGVQVYTANNLDGTAEQGGHGAHSGLCLETQFFPDSVHHPEFPSPVLHPGATMHHWTTYTLK